MAKAPKPIHYRVTELHAENIKKLRAVTIEPTGDIVQITGANEQGKTSLLDSIIWLLGGADGVQAAPIRAGETEAFISGVLGPDKPLTVVRTFKLKPVTDPETGEETGETKVTTKVQVTTEEGAKFPKPQELLDALLGALSFDPLAFTNMKPADQVKVLRGFVRDPETGTPTIDFDAIEKANKADYEARAEANRDAKKARAAAGGILVTPEDIAKRSPIDIAALEAALVEAGEMNAGRERTIATVDRMVAAEGEHRKREQNARNLAASKQRDAAELRRRATALDEEAENLLREAAIEHDAADAKLAEIGAIELPEITDTVAITAKLREAREFNADIERDRRMLERRQTLEREAAEAEARSAALTKAIEDRQAEIRKAIESAPIPVPHLTFGPDGVFLEGIPFDQASKARQLRTSVAIGSALNPRLRVMLIHDGSLIDDNGMKALAEFAKAQDMQIWIERVTGSGEVGFEIEDGALKHGG